MLINLLKKIKTIDYINNIPIEIIILVIVAASPCFLFNIMPLGIDNAANSGRIFLLAECIKKLDFPIYVNHNTFNGYGSLDFIFYPYGSIILPSLIQILTNNLILTTNIYISLIIIVQIYIVYISTKCIFNDNNTSTVSAILFILSYINIWNIYYRGGYYEALAISFIPLTIAGVYKTFYSSKFEDKSIYVVVGITGILQAHVVTSVFYIVMLMLILVFTLPMYIKKIKLLFKNITIILLLNIWYIYPFIKSYIVENINISTNMQLLPIQSVLGIFNKIPMTIHSISLNPIQIYKAFENTFSLTELVLVLIYISLLFIRIKSVDTDLTYNYAFRFSIFMFFVFILHCINYTQCFVKFCNLFFLNKFFALEQFNYRELERAMPFYVFSISPMIVDIFNTKVRRIILILILALTSSYIFAQQFLDPSNNYFIRKDSKYLLYTVNSNKEIYDIIHNNWMIADYIPSSYDGTELLKKIDTNCNIDNVIIEEKKCEFDFLSDNNVKKSFILPYFKYYGYKAYLNGEKYNGISEHNGKIELTTNLQNGHFKIEYKKPIDFLVSFYISFCFIICILIYRVISWRRKVNVQKY